MIRVVAALLSLCLLVALLPPCVLIAKCHLFVCVGGGGWYLGV